MNSLVTSKQNMTYHDHIMEESLWGLEPHVLWWRFFQPQKTAVTILFPFWHLRRFDPLCQLHAARRRATDPTRDWMRIRWGGLCHLDWQILWGGSTIFHWIFDDKPSNFGIFYMETAPCDQFWRHSGVCWYGEVPETLLEFVALLCGCLLLFFIYFTRESWTYLILEGASVNLGVQMDRNRNKIWLSPLADVDVGTGPSSQFLSASA